MSRIVAILLRLNGAAFRLSDDALGEILRGSDCGDVAPEVLLRIL